MADYVQCFLFGDQTLDISHALRQLIRTRHSPALTCYLRQCLHALQHEATRCGASLSLRFHTMEELLDLHEDGSLAPALKPALTCLYQLGTFIRFYAQHDRSYPDPSNTLLLGLCTGALSTAAVSCSTSIQDLVVAAAQTVVVAFRLGICVEGMARRLEPHLCSEDAIESWSMLVVNLDSEAASKCLEEFSRQRLLPPSSKPYISSVSPKGVAISGSPSILEKLQATDPLSRLRIVKLPIQGPFHASHLFSQNDVENILDVDSRSSRVQCMGWIGNYPVASSMGETLTEGTLRGRLRDALEGILLHPIQWDKLVKAVFYRMQSQKFSCWEVCPIGTTTAESLCTSLRQICEAKSADVKIHQRVFEDITAFPDGFRGHQDRSKIAIVGFSGRYPSADNNEQFWELLRRGLDVHKEVPDLRWDLKTHVDRSGKRKNTSATPYGCWLENPGLWDARFFNVSPREAPQIDPAQRLALLTAYEAIEQAGIVPGATPSTRRDRVGVFYGVTSNDWMETNSAQDIDTYFIPGGNRAFIPGRINYFFKFSGPSYAVDTACSSSLAAIHVACNALWQGDVDTAVAGGANVLTNPDFTAGLDRGHFLSRTGNCKTFDDTADGYCRGEAVVTVILKRLEDALADKDPIQGIILGAYTNHSAEAESITRPHAEAQKAVFRKILGQTGVEPDDIGYVECHGTGTQAGDAREMESILSVFAPKAGLRQNPLYLGSAKANVGHGEGASGASSLAKVLLMMHKNAIPPHCGIKTRINHKFPGDLQQKNVHIAKQPASWVRSAGWVRRAFVNNFSAAGGNTALLLEDAPAPAPLNMSPRPAVSGNGVDSRTIYPIAVSAKSASSLAGNLESMLAFLKSSDASRAVQLLPALSYTTTARRIHHPCRVMLTGGNIADIQAQLEGAIAGVQGKNKPKRKPKILFAFTGQGAQYPGMGKELFESFSVFRDEILQMERLALSFGLPEFRDLFLNQDTDTDSYNPVAVQLALVCMEIALAQLWSSWGVEPTAGVVGHSLGEYAALQVAGVLSVADTIYLVGKRAQLVVERCTKHTHSMLAVSAPLMDVTAHLRGRYSYEIACLNSLAEVVLSGTSEEMQKAQATLTEKNIKSTILKVPYAFHSSQVDPILDEFEAVASGVRFRSPNVPVFSPLLGIPLMEDQKDLLGPTYLRRHLRETVNLEGVLSAAKHSKLINDECIVLELGPHPVVSGMIKSIAGSHIRTVSSMRRGGDVWHSLATALSVLYTSGHDIQWSEYHRDFPSCHEVVQLPAYSWELKNYWIQYVHDWSLRKGDPLLAPELTAYPSLNTTTIHKTVKETRDGCVVSLVVESDISRPDLNPLVQGHRVDGIPLCTPSLYADIALTLGKYLLGKYRSIIPEQIVELGRMEVEKALISNPAGGEEQILRSTVQFNLESNTGEVAFYSLDGQDQVLAKHATSAFRFTEGSEVPKLQSELDYVHGRVKDLENSIIGGDTYRFNTKMIYTMVSGVAQFHKDYKCIDSIILNSAGHEAAGWVDLTKVKSDGTFSLHPAYVDGFTQIGGFVMNANDATDLDKEVFVNHGWDSCLVYEELSPGRRYQTYVEMKHIPSEGNMNMWKGDVLVFSGDTVIARFAGVQLLGVSRRVLHYILTAETGKAPQRAPSKSIRMTSNQATVNSVYKHSGVFDEVMRIIIEESGIDHNELTGDAAWADIGFDSLLSLIVSSRLKDELSLDISASQFLSIPTVRDLKAYLENHDPVLIFPRSSSHTARPALQTGSDSGRLPSDFSALVTIISEESGIALKDLNDDSEFADIGVDSLLGLVIASRASQELSFSFDFPADFLLEHPSLGDLRKVLIPKANENADITSDRTYHPTPSETTTPDAGTPPSSPSTPFLEETFSSVFVNPTKEAYTSKMTESRQTISIVLQSSRSSESDLELGRALILFPDGSGSAFSYAHLPRISEDTRVIALNSPFRSNPEEMARSNVDTILERYLVEIQARQPHGPYHLAGWSIGGIWAYLAAQQLIKRGEVVETLGLIDSPEPMQVEKLPPRFYDHLEKHDIFGREHSSLGEKRPPKWLIPHFRASIELLMEHFSENDLTPVVGLRAVCVIWATESVMDGVNVPELEYQLGDPEGMKFLSERRTDFSPGVWTNLFPGAEVSSVKIEGANHFSMMKGEYAQKLAEFMRTTITRD